MHRRIHFSHKLEHSQTSHHANRELLQFPYVNYISILVVLYLVGTSVELIQRVYFEVEAFFSIFLDSSSSEMRLCCDTDIILYSNIYIILFVSLFVVKRKLWHSTFSQNHSPVFRYFSPSPLIRQSLRQKFHVRATEIFGGLLLIFSVFFFLFSFFGSF